MNTYPDYLIKIEDLMDKALSALSPEEFEKLIEGVQELVDLYKY